MFKRAEGPYKLRVQITFGAACPRPSPRLPWLVRACVCCVQLAVTPLWHRACLALVTSAWPWSVGASFSVAASRPPAPAAQLVWLPAPRSRHAVQLDPQPLTWTLCEPEPLSGSAVVLQDFFFFHLFCSSWFSFVLS